MLPKAVEWLAVDEYEVGVRVLVGIVAKPL